MRCGAAEGVIPKPLRQKDCEDARTIWRVVRRRCGRVGDSTFLLDRGRRGGGRPGASFREGQPQAEVGTGSSVAAIEQLDLPVKVVVFNNGTLGFIELEPSPVTASIASRWPSRNTATTPPASSWTAPIPRSSPRSVSSACRKLWRA